RDWSSDVCSSDLANQAPAIAGEKQEAEILVLLRDIDRGQRIAEGDLDWAPAASARAARNVATDIGLVVGMELRRSLKAGQPLQTSDLKQPTLIRRGEPVRPIYASAGPRPKAKRT